MKQVFLILLSLTAVLLCTSCHNETLKDDTSGTQSSVTEHSKASSDPQPTSLLDATFGTLYKGDTYYIKTDMTVESTSSSENSSRYQLTIAVDKTNNTAMLYMKVENGSENHIIIREKQSYNLNDKNKTYTVQSFEDSIDLFAGLYTSGMYLGLTEPLELMDSGRKTIKLDNAEKNVTYEEYRMTGDNQPSQEAEDAYITYYFDNRQPCMEVMEAAGGKTTFVFRQITSAIPDKSVFEIPKDYERS